MTPEALKLLIESDQEAAKYFEAGNDTSCAKRLSEIADPIRSPASADDLQRVASLSGGWARVVLASRESSQAPDEIKGVCITFVDWVKAGRVLDFDLPQVQAMIDGLIAAGVVTKEIADELSHLGTVPQIVTTNEVSALRVRVK